jgi:hypothetical protein
MKSDGESEGEWKFNVVQELKQDNFATTLAAIEHSLVMFYAPCKYFCTGGDNYSISNDIFCMGIDQKCGV